MEEILLEVIAQDLTLEELKEKIEFNRDENTDMRLEELVEQALEIAVPRGLYGIAFIDERDEDGVVIEGVEFHSRILRENLEDVHRVFPFIITCGVELQEWAEGFEDMMDSYLADTIKEVFLNIAREQVLGDISSNFNPGKTARMNPGSLPDWPLAEQSKLFSLFSDVKGKIGVELTDSQLMKPNKSVSGLLFPSESDYENCQLCPRENCPNRSAAFEEELYRERLG